MKSSSIRLVLLILLVGAAPSFARVAKKTYAGSYKGQPCSVQMTWENWEGLGAIEGVIKVASGATIPFSGSNSQPGVIQFRAGGESFRLVRKDLGKTASWTSSKFSFTESAPAPTPTPKPSPSPVLEPLSADSGTSDQMMDENYTGNLRGQELTAHIRWAPGDEPGIVRLGRGTITLANGQQISVEARQGSAESAEFTIKPDDTTETYKTRKITHDDGNPSWASESLILTEKK